MTFKAKTKMRCGNCGDVIWSRYSGEFRACKCFKDDSGIHCAIDETEHYCRWIGSGFEIQNEKGEWYDPIKAMEKDKKH